MIKFENSKEIDADFYIIKKKSECAKNTSFYAIYQARQEYKRQKFLN